MFCLIAGLSLSKSLSSFLFGYPRHLETKKSPISASSFLSTKNSQDTSLQEVVHLTNDSDSSVHNNSDLDNILSLLNRSHYYGQWRTIENSNILEFEEKTGFTALHSNSLRTFTLNLRVYDGQYVDKGALTILLDDLQNPDFYNNSNS